MGKLIWAFTMFACKCKLVAPEAKGFRCTVCKRFFDELPLNKPAITAPVVIEFRKAS